MNGLSIIHTLRGEDFSPTNQVSNPTLLSAFFHFLLIHGTFKLRTKRNIREAKKEQRKEHLRGYLGLVSELLVTMIFI
jgi:hypothetical protein